MCCVKAASFLKKHYQQKKIGHLGTLDPIATGVLPIFAGKYTKLIPYFQDEDKTYLARIRLGSASITLDTESKITSFDILPFALAQVKQVIKGFQRELLQEVPLYSALKYKGKPQYYYARKNIEIPKKKKKITIFTINLLSYKHPLLELKICCSKGCYIRSLAKDIGQNLGTCAILEELTRIKIGKKFTQENIVSLDEILKKEYDKAFMLEPWDLLNNYTLVNIHASAIAPIRKGQKIEIDREINNQKEVFIFLKQSLIAAGVALRDQERLFFQPRKLFI